LKKLKSKNHVIRNVNLKLAWRKIQSCFWILFRFTRSIDTLEWKHQIPIFPCVRQRPIITASNFEAISIPYTYSMAQKNNIILNNKYNNTTNRYNNSNTEGGYYFKKLNKIVIFLNNDLKQVLCSDLSTIIIMVKNII